MPELSSRGPILVTGGAGFIGSHVVYALQENNFEVVVLDNLSTGNYNLLPSNIDFIKGDAGDENFVETLLNEHSISSVMHFAGSIVVPESVKEPLNYYMNNTVVSRSLLSACVKAQIRNFIFSSTASVYGRPDKMPVDENTPVAPETPYGRSKLMTEWMLEDVSKSYNLNYAALRYFNVAGADIRGRTGQCSPNATHLIKVANEVASGKRTELVIYGDNYDTPDGSCIRDYIHVSDLADAHVKVLQLLQSRDESFVLNCGYGVGHSVKEVVAEYKHVIGRDIKTIVGSRRNGDVGKLVSNPARLMELINWTPKHANLREIISTSLAWEKINIDD